MAQRDNVKSVVSISKTLGAFSTLSRPFIEVTQEYYEDMAATHAANVQTNTLTGTEFVKWALDKEAEERERAEQCFSPETAVEVVDVFRHVTGEMVADKVVRQGEWLSWLC
jgi:triphosphoribosyl-dephospho-CoA synthetase